MYVFDVSVIGYTFLVLCVIQLLVPQASFSTFNYKKCAKNWVTRGCRIDDDKGMTTLFDDRKNGIKQIDWNNVNGYIWDLACRCREAAAKMGHSWFALENYGVCFSGRGEIEKFFKKYPLDPDPSNCIGELKLNKTIVNNKTGELCVGGQMRAYFYKLTDVGPTGGDNPDEEEEQVKSCNKISDVVVAIDVSGSVGEHNFKLIKEFFQTFANAYDFKKGKSRLAILTFDEKVQMQLTWKDSAIIGAPKIREIIDKMRYSGGSTMTQRALKHVVDHIIKPYRRPGVPVTLFLVSDGKSWHGKIEVKKQAKRLQALQCTSIAIGVGKDIDKVELMAVANSTERLFLFSSFKNLHKHAAKLLNKLIETTCK